MRAIGFISASEPEARLLDSIERCIEAHACERVYLLSPSAEHGLSPDQAPDLIEIALSGAPSEIDALLEARRRARLLQQTYSVPASPTKSIELLGDRLVLLTAEKGALDEEDIMNVNAILFGDSDEAFAKLFGPRLFASPGKAPGAYGVLSCDLRGFLDAKIHSREGALLAHAATEGGRARFTISS